MPESFGAGLRQRRERLNISLATIAEQTKINPSLLEGLERDDVSRWPSGIFRRAFVRAYADAIRLDPEIVVREFLALYPEPIDGVGTAFVSLPNVDAAALTERPPTGVRHLLDTAIDSLFHRRSGTSVPLDRSAVEDLAAAYRPPAEVIAPPQPDLLAAAHLCTELAQVDEKQDAAPLLQKALRILDAVGLIVWVWNPQTAELTPALAYGYSEKVLAQLPKVRRDDGHATAAAFRSAETTVVKGSPLVSGALVVPLRTAAGCVGVLAVELKHDCVQSPTVRALVTIFAAQLARVVEGVRQTAAADRRLA